MIELIPAIDIIDGHCVRLTKGDYDQKTVYGDPLEMARQFEAIGYKRLHVVDLDGAKSKHIVNDEVLRRITSQTSLIVVKHICSLCNKQILISISPVLSSFFRILRN